MPSRGPRGVQQHRRRAAAAAEEPRHHRQPATARSSAAGCGACPGPTNDVSRVTPSRSGRPGWPLSTQSRYVVRAASTQRQRVPRDGVRSGHHHPRVVGQGGEGAGEVHALIPPDTSGIRARPEVADHPLATADRVRGRTDLGAHPPPAGSTRLAPFSGGLMKTSFLPAGVALATCAAGLLIPFGAAYAAPKTGHRRHRPR